MAKSIAAACREAKLSRATMMALRQADEAFRAAWDEALLDGADYLEDVARRVAIEGHEVVETTVEKDSKRTVRKTYDGALLRFLLRGVKPDVYGAHPRAMRSDPREAIWDDPDPAFIERGRAD